MRADLYAKTGISDLRPYDGWADFQDQNNLTDAVMNQLKAAYPEGFDSVDLWVGGLAEAPANGQLGSTMGYIFLEQMQRLQDGDRFYYLQIFDDSLFQNANQTVTFADILMRNTGLTGLDQFVFEPEALGRPKISDATPSQGQALVASLGSVRDADGVVGAPTYAWQARVAGSWVAIAGATSATFTPGLAQVGQQLRVKLSFVDGDGNAETRTSSATTVVGAFLDGTGVGDALTGTAGADRMFGRAANDTLAGLAGDDTVTGGTGNDALTGGSGADRLSGDAGTDRLAGGAGNDLLFGGNGPDTAVFGGRAGLYRYSRDDALAVADTRGGMPDGTDQLTSMEQLDFAGTVLRLVAGTNLANAALGGGAAGDLLLGFDGADVISGNGGNDVIVGGRGADVMNGGLGNDVFVFETGSGSDRINGFDADVAGGQDQIDLGSRGITAAGFAAAVTLSSVSGGTTIAVGDDRIVLAGVSLAQIDITDFLLA